MSSSSINAKLLAATQQRPNQPAANAQNDPAASTAAAEQDPAPTATDASADGVEGGFIVSEDSFPSRPPGI